MTKDKEIKINKPSAKLILDYIVKNKCKTSRKGDIIVKGKSTLEYAHTLPRSLLELNISNHRFTTAMKTLQDERAGRRVRLDNVRGPPCDSGTTREGGLSK